MTSPSLRRRAGVAGATVAALLVPAAIALPASASTTANEVVYTADANGDGLYGVVLRDLESRRATVVLPEPTTAQGWIYDDPDLSPTGDRVAFSTDRGSATVEQGIATVTRSGGTFTRRTNPVSTDSVIVLDVSPAWSPDGSTLLFTRLTIDVSDPASQTSTSRLMKVAATGTSAPVAVAGAADGYTGDWSPDGSKIVFAAVAPNGDSGRITVVNAADGTGRTGLGTADKPAVGLTPTWSPDNRTIAYATITERDTANPPRDVAQIATVPAAGGTPTVLARTRPTSARSVAEYPSWTPDSAALVYDLFTYASDGSFAPGDLWAYDLRTNRVGKVTATSGDEAQAFVQGPKPSTVVAPGTGSTYTSTSPRRILDTREGVGAAKAKVGAGGVVSLQVTGAVPAVGGGTVTVPANASAVVLNVTVTGTTANTDVRAYPAGAGVPSASNLNAGASSTVPNLVTVRVGTGGKVNLRNSGGTVHLLADLAGWYTPDTTGDGFTSRTPARILDTRPTSSTTGATNVGAPARAVGPGGFVDLQVTGTIPAVGGTLTVPAGPTGASAVVLNVTATGPTATTDVRLYPTGSALPEVSNLNLRAGQTLPNLVTVAVGEGGKVRLRNAGGSVHLIADLAGYYSASSGGRFFPVAPARFLDTRAGIGGAPIPVLSGTGQDVVDPRIAGTRGVPAGATAAVINLTATAVSTGTDVRAYPFGSPLPPVSNLNLVAGSTRANLAIVKLGTEGRLRLRNLNGQVHLIGDLAGYMVG